MKKSITNIASEYRIANIVRDHAMILADDATPKPDGIFGKDNVIISSSAQLTAEDTDSGQNDVYLWNASTGMQLLTGPQDTPVSALA